jgi:hypothetical protein
MALVRSDTPVTSGMASWGRHPVLLAATHYVLWTHSLTFALSQNYALLFDPR